MSKKWAIITGASTGIGFSLAKEYLSQGFSVINISRRECRLPGVINMNWDLQRTEGLGAILQKNIPRSSVIVLVHNAFHYFKDTTDEPSLSNFDAAVAVGLKSPMTLNQILIPLMKKGSSIVYIGSTLSTKAVGGNFTYVTLKHAVVGMMRATVQDLMGRGITSFCVCPGFTDTPMLKKHLDPKTLKIIAGKNSFKRLVTPSEIALAVRQLASTPAANGSIIDLNLGQHEQ